MTKIVYNGCYGGFSLSDEAIEMYLDLQGIKYKKQENAYSFGGTAYYVNDEPFWELDIKRTDPVLVQVVETLGDKANGLCAKLVVEEIPASTLYRIKEYDGFERIETRENVDWQVA